MMGERNVLWCVKRIDFFDELTEEGLKRVAQISKMLTLRRGQQIFTQSEPGDHVYCLASGRVKISRFCPEGKELIVDIIMPGGFFGEILGGGETLQDTVAEAMDDVLLCLIPRSRFEQLLRVHPELSFRLIELIGLRLRWIESRVADLVCKDVQARLATILLHLAREHGTRDSRGVLLRHRITQQQLADLIGASRGVVNQTLGDFRRRGLISIERRRIIISDRNALASL
ncbi:MAG: Crp/Fnr family transcriptional regulator, partial [Candidatus Methylomirabilis oxyfera]|nr:Crp/Fnr family transcriptional regulator [Candidatus Methylomirabilis oxyfera]